MCLSAKTELVFRASRADDVGGIDSSHALL